MTLTPGGVVKVSVRGRDKEPWLIVASAVYRGGYGANRRAYFIMSALEVRWMLMEQDVDGHWALYADPPGKHDDDE